MRSGGPRVATSPHAERHGGRRPPAACSARAGRARPASRRARWEAPSLAGVAPCWGAKVPALRAGRSRSSPRVSTNGPSLTHAVTATPFFGSRLWAGSTVATTFRSVRTPRLAPLDVVPGVPPSPRAAGPSATVGRLAGTATGDRTMQSGASTAGNCFGDGGDGGVAGADRQSTVPTTAHLSPSTSNKRDI